MRELRTRTTLAQKGLEELLCGLELQEITFPGPTHLGSKRGVMSGVGPISRDESSTLLAGVTKGFLLDLNPETCQHLLSSPRHRGQRGLNSPSDGGALLADRQRLRSFRRGRGLFGRSALKQQRKAAAANMFHH